MVLCGAAGVGKSRLAREALSRAESDGAVVHFVQATRSAATVALGAFGGLIAADARSDDLYELMQRVSGSLAEHAGGRPLVVGVDDAQWLDSTSAAVTLELLNSGTAFVIATIRDGESAPDAVVSLWKDAGAQRIEVGLLSRPETERLVDEMLMAPLEREARRWVAETSQGNALYVRELVLGARAGGALQQVDGLWRLLVRPPVSASLKELITARMAGLEQAEHRLLELLALGEPLRLSEAVARAGVEPVTTAEERGVVSVEGSSPDAAVRLAHPLYGEVIRSSLGSVRGREARLRLVETIRARDSQQPEDTIRLARWLIEAGEAPGLELLLAASRAANNAADPDFGGALAERALAAGGGLQAALLLARAHAARNRFADAEAVLDAAEPSIETQADALEYLEAQSEVLHWGLQSPSDLKELLSRAATWWKDREWQQHIAAMRLRTTSFEHFGVDVAASTQLLEGAGAKSRLRPQLEKVHVANLFYSGRAQEALKLALRMRPSIPWRTLSDSIAVSVWRRVSLDSGEGWDELEEWMTRALEDAVGLGDHATIGQAAYSLASLRFLQGRYEEARAYAIEAERQMEQHDPVGLLPVISALLVEIACVTCDRDAITPTLEKCLGRLREGGPLAHQLPYVVKAQAWALHTEGDPGRAQELLLKTAANFSASPIHCAALTYEALRAGAPARRHAQALQELSQRCDARLVTAYANHATALQNDDGIAFAKVADAMELIGAIRYATEAAAHAADAFAREGRQDSARRAAARSGQLHARGKGAPPPPITELDPDAVRLSPREAQTVQLAAEGLSNAQIAERLVLSSRTVESHLYRAMQKLGIPDRRQLPRAR